MSGRRSLDAGISVSLSSSFFFFLLRPSLRWNIQILEFRRFSFETHDNLRQIELAATPILEPFGEEDNLVTTGELRRKGQPSPNARFAREYSWQAASREHSSKVVRRSAKREARTSTSCGASFRCGCIRLVLKASGIYEAPYGIMVAGNLPSYAGNTVALTQVNSRFRRSPAA